MKYFLFLIIMICSCTGATKNVAISKNETAIPKKTNEMLYWSGLFAIDDTGIVVTIYANNLEAMGKIKGEKYTDNGPFVFSIENHPIFEKILYYHDQGAVEVQGYVGGTACEWKNKAVFQGFYGLYKAHISAFNEFWENPKKIAQGLPGDCNKFFQPNPIKK